MYTSKEYEILFTFTQEELPVLLRKQIITYFFGESMQYFQTLSLHFVHGREGKQEIGI